MLIFYESIFLGGISLLLGGLAGLIFVKLFLLAIAAILSLPRIPFTIPSIAVWDTIIRFGLLFLVEGIIIAIRIAGRTPRLLLVASRVRQQAPRISTWKVLASDVMIGIGYVLALDDSRAFPMTMVPIVILVSVGTYLFYTQVSVRMLARLRKINTSGVTGLVVARLAHRVRDDAQILTVVTLLSAIVLTGMGSVFGAQQFSRENSLRLSPFGIQCAFNNQNPPHLSTQQILRIIATENLHVTDSATIPFFSAKLRGTLAETSASASVMVISQSSFEHLREMILKANPMLGEFLPDWTGPQTNQANFMYPYPYMVPTFFSNHQAKLQLGSYSLPIEITGQRDTRLFNEQNRMDAVLVVSNLSFAHLTRAVPPKDYWHMEDFIVSNWQQSQHAIDMLNSRLLPSERWILTDTVSQYSFSMQFFSVTLFAGFFVSILFFLACGSTLYFRLSVQKEDDARQFNSLRRIGLDRQQASRILSVEIACLFFIPFIMATIHSTIAILEFTQLLPFGESGWSAYALTVGLYFVCLLIYNIFIRTQYIRSVLRNVK